MTRIALLPSSYPPSLGGVEELTRHLALSLVAAGDQVEVWTGLPDDSSPESVEVLDGLVVRRLPMPLPATNLASIRRTLVTGPRTLVALRRAADAFRPDVLHVQCFGPNGAYATALARIVRRPLVVTLQGETMMDDADIFEESRVLRAALRSGIRHAAAVTACSAFTLADAEARFGLTPGRGQVVFNGVSLGGASGVGVPGGPDRATAPLTAVAGDPPRPYVFALGRVVDKKGFDLLLAAYAGMDPVRRTSDLVIAGSGAALEGLERKASELGLADRVHFVGRLSREEVAGAMAGADLFVMPSRLEPFGIVVLEAWRAGVAVMATTRGGAPEFVEDGETGVLVDPFDTPGFTAALETVLADGGSRAAMAAAGHARVRAFDWPRIADQYRTIYDSVTGGPRQTSAVGPTGAASGRHVGEAAR
jgi:glycogen(starch) synthase